MLMHLAVNRVLPRCHPAPLLAPARKIQAARPLVPCRWSKRDEVLSNWEALRANPNEWFDNRNRKTNPKQPDFVRKDDRSVAIWVEGRDVPDWCDDLLAQLDVRQQEQGQGRSGGDKRAAELANWEALRNNPEEWFDNRNRKTNPKQPDFRKRDDRMVALWLDSYGTPEWVGDLLAELDARQSQRGGGYNQGPSQQQQYQQDSPDLGARRAEERANWEALRSNPADWFDNRNNKLNPKQPDFKRKDDRSVALWLSSYDLPEWIEELLAELDTRQEQRAMGQQYQQQGYQQQQQGGGVMMDRDGRRAEELANWEALRNNPDEWFDNRHSKTNPKWPDFRRKDDRTVALWLTSRGVPEWVGDLVAELDARHEQRNLARY